MLPRVIDARYAGEYRVWLRFADGLSGEVDLASELWGPMFEPLKDKAEFAKLRAEPDFDTIVWANGADLSPEWLRERLKAVLAGRDAAERRLPGKPL